MLTLKSLSSASTYFYTYKILNYAYKITTMYPKRASTNCPIFVSYFWICNIKTKNNNSLHLSLQFCPSICGIHTKKKQEKKEETSDTQINGIHPQTLTFLKRFRKPIIVFYYSYITIYIFFLSRFFVWIERVPPAFFWVCNNCVCLDEVIFINTYLQHFFFILFFYRRAGSIFQRNFFLFFFFGCVLCNCSIPLLFDRLNAFDAQ